MKRTSAIVAVVLTITGCKLSDNGNPDVVLGTYTRRVHNEFSDGRDTLLIKHLEGAAYGIQHRMAYRRMVDGKAGTVETKTEHWTALYDEAQGVLRETKRGRILSFQPEKKTLLVGSSVYQKLD